MKIGNFKENEDGSAEFVLHTDVEETKRLVEVGFVTLLERALAEDKGARKIPALLRSEAETQHGY